MNSKVAFEKAAKILQDANCSFLMVVDNPDLEQTHISFNATDKGHGNDILQILAAAENVIHSISKGEAPKQFRGELKERGKREAD